MCGEVGIHDEAYPEMLRDLKDPPNTLYYKGFWDNTLFDNCLAVVGSRKMTSYGKKSTQNIVFELASRGMTIVSGFMYGIDATAHKSALDAGGKTIAVMACGIDIINPYYQKPLYDRIISDGGLVITEYPGDQRPQLWAYPKRNRIVAALSKGVFVVEAAEDSGSLITAAIATGLNKRIFALPGRIDSINSIGTHKLISSGATLVSGSRELLDYFAIFDDTPMFCTRESDSSIVNLLLHEPMSGDDISKKLSLPAQEVGAKVTMLLLENKIYEQEGKYYVN
ncbi:DNA-processing protein DprA [bacterium]|nr:DNA-processing protein DprA [bacterium]